MPDHNLCRIGPFALIYNIRLNIYGICHTSTFFQRKGPEGIRILFGTFDECIEYIS